MAKHKKKSLAKHQRKKRNRGLKAIGEQVADGFRKGVEKHDKGTDRRDQEGYPFPDNVKVEFEEYCRGCKMCELEPINFTSGKQIYSCIHSILCDRAYNTGLNIAGGIREGCRNDETEVEDGLSRLQRI